MEGGRRSLCGGCPGAARARVFAAFRDAAANAVSLEAASASSQSRVAPGRVGTHREQLSGRHKSGRLNLCVPAGGLARHPQGVPVAPRTGPERDRVATILVASPNTRHVALEASRDGVSARGNTRPQKMM